MKRTIPISLLTVMMWTVIGCGPKQPMDENAAAPPVAKVVEEPDLNIVRVPDANRFPTVAASERADRSQISATGVVNPDIERSIPVVSLASGRVVEIDAKIGDDVKKGQLLLKVLSNDISNAFQTYRQAQADEVLARKQLERAQLLYQHGAIALNDQEVAEDAEAKARVAEDSAAQQLKTLGADLNHPSPIVNVVAPISGNIVEQNTALSASVHTPDNQTNLFTIANMMRVWVIADVYENDLPGIKLGDSADVEADAYPGHILHGRIGNIGTVLDPTIRTAKVRIEIANPGFLRSGMFVRATFFGQHTHENATVPAGAVLHLHDRDWVFVPNGTNQFRRTEVSLGGVNNGQQDIVKGISPGQQVVANALALSSESEQ